MKILFLSSWYPYPANNGSKIRIYNLLRGLAEYHEVTLISFSDEEVSNPLDSPLGEICSDIKVVSGDIFQPSSMKAKMGFFSSRPRFLVDTFSPAMRDCIQETLASEDYDLVIASQIIMASYHQYFNGLPAIFDEAEIGLPHDAFHNASSIQSRLRNGLTWAKQRRYMNTLASSFDACTVVSKKEQELLEEVVPEGTRVEVIPNSIDHDWYQQDLVSTSENNDIIFTGSFRYMANYDAMNWFLEDIYPRVREKMEDIRLLITGDHADLPLPSTNHVELTGYVEDIRPLIASAKLAIVPLRMGGGTRLKILEAMSLKTPVISTSKGAEGLDVQNGHHLLIADTPTDFSDSVLRLMADSSLRERLSRNAFQVVKERYDWAKVLPDYLDLVESIAAS